MTKIQRFSLHFSILFSLCFSSALIAAGQSFTILHTNDWQSRLLGFGPNTEYTPETLNNDTTVGGVARLATRIDQLREKNNMQPVLLLDGGDISQGSLFHTLYRTQAAELRLMKKLGYDAITLGNHEFDFRTDGLSQMLKTARQHIDQLPSIVASNLELPPEQQDLREMGLIQPWKIIEKGGIRFGLIGILGKDADEVTPQAKPSRFADQIATAKKMVKLLREEQKADVVIMMSHSGVVLNKDGSWGGEEVEYARQVPGLDAIVGGHSHTALQQPIMVNGVPVLQAGSETRYLGELSLTLEEHGGVTVNNYILHPIDDRIPGKASITKKINEFKKLIDQETLAKVGYSFDQPLVKTPATLTRQYDDPTLGNLIADAIRQATDSDIAMTTNGIIRDDLLQGTSGYQATSDIFRLQPLGLGLTDKQPGYPLMKVWLTAKELRGLMEILSFAWVTKGEDYYPRISGLRFTYNNLRPPLDRITSMELGSSKTGFTPLDLSDEKSLYSFGASSFIGNFTWVLGDLSYGMVAVTPKDKQGRPLLDLADSLVDYNTEQSGIQEYKNWQAQLDFFSSLPDTDGDGIANITLDENVTTPRMVAISSLRPEDLLRNATWILWTVTGVLFTLLVIIIFTCSRFFRRFKSGD